MPNLVHFCSKGKLLQILCRDDLGKMLGQRMFLLCGWDICVCSCIIQLVFYSVRHMVYGLVLMTVFVKGERRIGLSFVLCNLHHPACKST